MSQYTVNDSNNCFNNTNSFNSVWNNCTFADDRSQLLNWLSPLEPRLRHRDVQERRVDKVGEWLIQSEEFRSWYGLSREGEDDKPVLFCYGDPGVGKTFISSLVVDRLCDRARGKNTDVTCFYFDFATRKEQSATSMLGSLLKQVISGMETIPEGISRAYQEQKRAIGGRGPQLADIMKMLQTIASSHRIFICIDALDECVPMQRAKILDSLRQILNWSPSTRIFVTGRLYVQAEIEKRLSGQVFSVSIGPRTGDIITYLHARLAEDETPDAMDESLKADILKKIPENISEMFLLVTLNVDTILQESTIHRRRERLSKMTEGLGLGHVYGTTIERIKAQSGDKSRLGMAALLWISHAERPLQANELCHALAVELGSTDLNAGNIPSMSTLLNCCQGLITVDKETSTVRLIHFTLQEYLSDHLHIFSRPHSTIAEICLTFLNSQQVKALSAGPFPDNRNTPFLEYCSVYWGVHARRELSDCARSLALELFQEYDGHISTKLLLKQGGHFYIPDSAICSHFSGLHCSSFFGIAELVSDLIEMECYDICEGDFSGCTPLAWAAHNGHDGTVKILLEQEGINANQPGNGDQTPLSLAAQSGHEGVVKILLEREEVNPEKPDNFGQTPLSYAAGYGREGVVKILLRSQDVSPGKPDNFGQTPLSYAASSGQEGVVKILLGFKDVNPDKLNNSGKAPLSYAAEYGHEGVVKILLRSQDVNPDRPDNYGRTPLSNAAEYGHEGVAKILLRNQDVSPDKPDNYGRTPLAYAAWFGHEGLVKILLGLEAVNPDKPGTSGQTPLSYAALCGHEGVVKILLGCEEVNPDTPDNFGRTSLSYAAEYGQEEVVKILLGCEDVKPDMPDNFGRTPLSLATSNGYNRVVALLQSSTLVTPSST